MKASQEKRRESNGLSRHIDNAKEKIMGYLEVLDKVEDLVRSAKGVPLSSSAIVPREELTALLGQLRSELPKETEQAKAVLSERDELLALARAEAQQLVDQAKTERARAVARADVVVAANMEAARAIAEAEAQSADLRRRCDDYMDAKLAKFEIFLAKTLKTVGKGRGQLQSRLEATAEEVQPFNLEDSGEFQIPVADRT